MKQERTRTEFENQMTNILHLFLSNNKKEFGLDGEDTKPDLVKLSREISATIYYFLKCKNLKV